MLNTQKLLYILPDVAYLAELMPGKKANTFDLQSFRQINGEFMDDNEFIGPNLLKLFNKLEEKEFKLILPDFLFTNTIVSVKEASDSKISKYLKDELLPDLGITTDSHQTETTVLTEYDKQAQVQLSALENSLLIPLQLAAEEAKLKIESISPLSWTLKSLISLEPSLSVAQINGYLYLALHYIGVDQTVETPIDNLDRLYETVKTLKGSEPSLQTLYLLSNDLIEEKLKTKLSDVLPIQQLAPESDEESKLPSFVQKIIESGMRTLSIADYPVPAFDLGKAPADADLTDYALAEAEEAEEKATEEKDEEAELPKPEKKTPAAPPVTAEKEEPEVETENLTTEEVEPEEKEEEDGKETKKTPAPVNKAPLKTTQPTGETDTAQRSEAEEDDEIDALLSSLKNEKEATKEKKTVAEKKVTKPKKIKRNGGKTRTMLKMVFVTLAVFFATVAIGIGLGLGVLRLTQDKPVQDVIQTQTSPTPIPTPSPSPSPSPEAQLDKENLSILVVNATTQPGYAGETADQLVTADFGSGENGTVDASNAQGDYEPGIYLLTEEEIPQLESAIEEATELEVTAETGKETEDAAGEYDAVLVLAE